MAKQTAPALTRTDPKTMQIALGYGEGEVRAESFDPESRTVEIVWAAGAPVKRYSWDQGYYIEELSMDPKAVRMGRFATGMSLLDSHDAFSTDGRLGTVVPGSARIEDGKGLAIVKLSRKPRAEELLQDLRDGHAFPVSVGYRTYAYEKTEGADGTLPKMRAIDWEPLELSAVPVPADAAAHSRAERAERFEAVIVTDPEPIAAAQAAPPRDMKMNKRDAADTFMGDALAALALGLGLARGDEEDDEALRARVLEAIERAEAQAATPPVREARRDEPRRDEPGETSLPRHPRAAPSRISRRSAASPPKRVARPSATGWPRSTRWPGKTGSTAASATSISRLHLDRGV